MVKGRCPVVTAVLQKTCIYACWYNALDFWCKKGVIGTGFVDTKFMKNIITLAE